MSRKPKSVEEAFENQLIARQAWLAGWAALVFGLGMIAYALSTEESNKKDLLGIGAMFVVVSGPMLFGSVWLKKRNPLPDFPTSSLTSSANENDSGE